MKMTIKKKYLLFAAAALTLAACSNDDENLNGGPVELRLSSGIEVQEVTRAATDIQNEAFDANEKIDVYINEATAGTPSTDYPQPMVYTQATTGNSLNPPSGEQPYFPSSGSGVTIHAVYPSSSETFTTGGYATDAESNTTFTIQTDQSENKNYKLSDLMYGQANNGNEVERTDQTIPLFFTHLLSKVTVILKAGAGLVDADLDGAKVELLGVKPTTTITMASGTIGVAAGTETDIHVFTATSSALSGSAIVVPQQLPVQFVRVSLADGGVLTGTLNDNTQPDLVTGNAYAYTITVNLTALNISAFITGWDEYNYDGTASMR